MSETTVVHSGGEGGETPLTDIAHDVGHVEAVAENTADKVEEHAEKISNVEDDTQWMKEEIARLNQELVQRPTQEAMTLLRSELDQIRTTISSQVSDGGTKPQESGDSTKEPEPTHNVAEETEKKVTGPLAGVRKLLHRLL